MEERFEGIQRRRPAQADRLAAQQVEIFMLTEQMGLLERLCRGQREYEFLRPTQERLARALPGSLLISVDTRGHTAYGQGHACVDAPVLGFLVSAVQPMSTPVCP